MKGMNFLTRTERCTFLGLPISTPLAWSSV